VLIVFQRCKGGDNTHYNIYLLDPRNLGDPLDTFFNFSPNKATKGGGDLTPTLRKVVSKIVRFLQSQQM
jgi:hypothetical protein